MLPTSYNLEGVVREGDRSKRISQVIEIWKGRYKDEVVALKVLKVPRQDPQILAFEGVSMPHGVIPNGWSVLIFDSGSAKK